MFGQNKVSQSLIDAVNKIVSDSTPTSEQVQLDEKKMEMKSVPVSAYDKNKSKLLDAHHGHLKNGYVYAGSSENEGPMGKYMTHHNYLAKDSSHHKHIIYPAHSMYDKDFELTHMTTRNNVHQHYDLSAPHQWNEAMKESVKLHEDLDEAITKPGGMKGFKASGSAVHTRHKELSKSIKRNKEVGVVGEEVVDESSNPFSKDYKSQAPTKPGEKAGFDSKKVSTGTVYTRKAPKSTDKDVKEDCKPKFADKFGADKRKKLLQDKESHQAEETQVEEVLVDEGTSVDPKKKFKDTLRGREKGGEENGHTSLKIAMKSEEADTEKKNEVVEEGKYFFGKTNGLNADIDRHRSEEKKLQDKIAGLEGKTDDFSKSSLKTHRGLLATLQQSKADTVSKIGKKVKKEEVEPLEELSKETLTSYADKSHKDLEDKLAKKDFGKKPLLHRAHGMQKVKDRLTKEETSPFEKIKDLARNTHKKIRKEMLGVAGGPEEKPKNESINFEEGYTLKKNAVDKEKFEPDEDGDGPTKGKTTKYDIVHNKSGKKVGHLTHASNNYFGGGDKAIGEVHGKPITVTVSSGNPQSAFNHSMKHNKRAPKNV